MPVASLQCPHCAGPMQIDAASAGQLVRCPHCQGRLMAPPGEVLAQFFGVTEGTPPVGSPPTSAHAESVTLACPMCNGPFQALSSMSGQQLGCPHCGSQVTIPPLGGASEPAALLDAAARMQTEGIPPRLAKQGADQ